MPNGIPGVAARLPILFSEGVKKGRISLSDFVGLTATNPAKMYGLYPRKGSVVVAANADIAIWDPDKKVTLSQDLMQHGSDYTPYEGMEVTGWPVKTLLRGTLIADNGQIVGAPGMGQFQARHTTLTQGSAPTRPPPGRRARPHSPTPSTRPLVMRSFALLRTATLTCSIRRHPKKIPPTAPPHPQLARRARLRPKKAAPIAANGLVLA